MLAGDVLDQRFRIEGEAGSGAMGIVLRAQDLHAGGPVAIKFLRGAHAHPRFQREARVLAQLQHPAIVRYVAHGTTARGAMYLVMEWLEGEDLSVRLERGPLSLADGLALARRIADALALAHAHGIVHRDLKPSNVFLPGGNVREAKLLDFGIARVKNATFAMTDAGAVIGTPGYMAPEQARGAAAIDARADVFSLGGVLFECLTGRAVFVAENLIALLAKILMEEAPRVSELTKGVPPPVDELVARMLSKAPSERPDDGAAARDAIAEVESHDPSLDETLVPARTPSITITRGEQHIVSVVLASGGSTPSASASVTAELGYARTEAGLEDALTRTEQPSPAAAAEVPARELARFGARVERLADGTIVATLHGVGGATDQAAQAARCALALRRIVPDAPIVLATGSAVVAGRLPVGRVIERAAEMLRAAPRGRAAGEDGAPSILLDEVTRGLLPSRFRVLDGASGPLLASEERDADVARTVLGRATRFVGRDAEMGTLSGLFAQVHGEAVARAAIVTGAPGLGKSRLREELVARLAASGSEHQLWMGSAPPLGSGAPLGMMARVLRSALGSADGTLDRKALVARVTRCVPASEAERVATFLAELVGAPLDAAPALPHAEAQLRAARREPPLMAEQLQRALVELLRAECASKPVVIVLEDAHWGDQPTMKLLDAALRDLGESPLLVVVFARPEIEGAFPSLWSSRSVLRINLAPLTARASERLAREVLGANADDAAVARLVAQALGNPFFLEELLRAFASDQSGAMPDTLLMVVQKRLESLDEDARHVLRAASVYGGTFWRGAAAAVLGGAEDLDLPRCLASLVDLEVLVRHAESQLPGEQELAFRHALLRDAAYQMLTDVDRVVAHGVAARWLEAAGEASQALLAEHFDRGGEKARAAQSYARAAAQALRADDLEACLRLTARGLELAAQGAGRDDAVRGALHLARAEAHHWRAQFTEAHRAAIEALGLVAPASEAWFGASAIALAAAATLGHRDEATMLARDLARAGGARTPAFLVAAAEGVAFLSTGDAADALLALLPATTAATTDPLLAARVHVARAVHAQASGDPACMLEQFTQAADAFTRAGHRRGARAARANAGYASTEVGLHEEAERMLREAIDDARKAGASGTLAWASMHLGMVLGRLRRPLEALPIEAEAAEMARSQGNRRLEAEVELATADILLASGSFAAAVVHAERACAAADTPSLRASAASSRARAHVGLGQATAAHEAALAAVAILDVERGASDAEAVVRLAMAEALHALGDVAAARREIERAQRHVRALAEAIADADKRTAFLTRMPVNAAIARLAAAWSTLDR